MSVSAEIDSSGFEKTLIEYQEKIKREFLDAWADALLFEAKKLLRRGKIEGSEDPYGGGAFDRGTVYESGVVIRTSENERMIKFGGRLAPHAIYIEYGTPAGHHPPVKPLQEWARRNKFKDWKNAGWAIAKKIEKYGLPARPFLRQATLSTQVKLKEIFREVMKDLDLD